MERIKTDKEKIKEAKRKIFIRRLISRVFLYLGIIFMLIVIMIPYGWMISSSFKTTLEIQSTDFTQPGKEPRWIPHNPTLENYIRVNDTVPMLNYLYNSLVISGGTMVFSILISMFASYALSRLRFRWKRTYTTTVFATQMFPGIAFVIPYYIFFILFKNITGIPLRDTYWGMIFTYTSFALPFCIIMLRNFFDAIPKSIDEQAQIDGCSRFRIIFQIIFPLSLPGIASVGIYAFILAWNEMLFASILTAGKTKPVSLGLMNYITQNQARWGGMMAACIVVSIPVLVLFTALQKNIVKGLISGAVKG